MCQDKSIRVNGEDMLRGYRYKCPQGYMGNPYIRNGCQDVNECESPELSDFLPGDCKNTYGSYSCVHPKRPHCDTKRGVQCTNDSSGNTSFIKGFIEGVIGAALTISFVYWRVKQKRKIEVRKDFFKQNGGIILQEMLFICKDTGNKAKIFTEEELKKATDNFNDANVIGQGGYAIKKSKVIDQSQVKQFVNEVIILSKITHPNIVELLGCCLETHIPLLVYEYVTNDTLCHHIHAKDPILTLDKRLKISEDIAEALSYLHSTICIIHRDVKPSNILLNDDFTAKVSDFGISRFVPPGQTHISTFVKGTAGYVDPEYFRTCNLTEKSDVYSFGVVLVELLTGTNIQSLEISLIVHKGAATYFGSLLEQNALVKVLDDQLKRVEYTKVVKCVTKIAVRCLDLEAKTRPTMKEIKEELKQLRCILLSIEADSI
ncbi:wall-associated receptor kinase 5-like [Bidens hawaiensis]|uniref:wall-associated receptor kinase 5-like n=1 Tax=Bidens hawaiensis TaxID=980011 RepID=UPI00404A9B15